MERGLLESKIKSTNTAYLFWFIVGSHYAYFGKWRLQIIFWLTLGGLGVWAILDFFLMSYRVDMVNARIYEAIDQREKQKGEDLVKKWHK